MSSKYDQLRFDNALETGKSFFVKKYQDLVIGDRNFGKLLQYELLTLRSGSFCREISSSMS